MISIALAWTRLQMTWMKSQRKKDGLIDWLICLPLIVRAVQYIAFSLLSTNWVTYMIWYNLIPKLSTLLSMWMQMHHLFLSIWKYAGQSFQSFALPFWDKKCMATQPQAVRTECKSLQSNTEYHYDQSEIYIYINIYI